MTAWNGTPDEPEKDGWHWVLSAPGRPFVAHWNAPLACWFFTGDGRHHEPAEVAACNAYLGPVRTDADLQAAGAAGALAMRAAIVRRLQIVSPARADDARTVPLPNPDALAAAVAEAVGKERVGLLAWADKYEATVKKHGEDPYKVAQIATLSCLRDAIRTRPTGGGSGT